MEGSDRPAANEEKYRRKQMTEKLNEPFLFVCRCCGSNILTVEPESKRREVCTDCQEVLEEASTVKGTEEDER